MPVQEFPKHTPHPYKAAQARGDADQHAAAPREAPAWAEVCVTSNYTFLTGASHPEEYVAQAASLGYRAVAIMDTNTLAGVVRAHAASKSHHVQVIIGSRLRLQDAGDTSVFLYPTSMAGYRNVCRLLTTGKRRAPKGECHLRLADVAEYARDVVALVMPGPRLDAEFGRVLGELACVLPGSLWIGASRGYAADDQSRLEALHALSARVGVPLAATGDVHYHAAERRMLQDVLTCIRHTCTLAQAGYRLHAHGERYLKPPEEMHRLFESLPGAIDGALAIAERTRGFTLDQLRYEYPDEIVPEGVTAQAYLEQLVEQGSRERFPGGVPEKVRGQIKHELGLIAELNYAPYFLTVYDIVRFARTGQERLGDAPPSGWKATLCQGRGAAANSAVCYCLGVTAVDPARFDLLFERFISRERNEPPDIDIDFEHERREEVIQYIYRKYGRERAALTAEVITYRRRSAIRDVGKALGLSLDLVDRLAKNVEWSDKGGLSQENLQELKINPDEQTVRWLSVLSEQILGFPRHLSQHVGGFVITRSPLCELVPVENAAMADRTVIEWDKDDIDAVGMLKVDVLGLGMLSALRKCLESVNAHAKKVGVHSDRRAGCVTGCQVQPLQLHTIPCDDPATYEMIQRADTVGVFQIESRAQMSMLPRLKPRTFYDLVIEVAIVRPGPIQGDMVHPYLRRRNGEEAVEYVHPAIEEVLKKTLGVPLFQEQCMALAIKAAGFTPGEADQLRRAMAAWKRKGDQLYRFGQRIIEGMVSRGIPRSFAERCFEQIKGFSEYGFPESHAASFALLVYASCWLKRHYPAHFTSAVINSQPMGFYAPAQLVRDAKEHGVQVRPIDALKSDWDCTIEPDGAIRLGLRLVSGLAKAEAERVISAARSRDVWRSLTALWRASGARAATMRRLAAADALASLGMPRQEAVWNARLLKDEPLPLFDQDQGRACEDEAPDGGVCLPALSPMNQVAADYNTIGLSLKAHPVSFARERLRRMRVRACHELRDAGKTPDGASVRIAGLVLVRQRPGTANNVTFITLEDESGIANLIVWYRVYQKFRREAKARMLLATGRVQRQGEVVHVVVSRLQGMNEAIEELQTRSRDFH